MLEAKTIQKYKNKSIAQLVQLAQKYFNAYIRKRDSQDGYFKCISCSKIKAVSQMNAGHFYSVGHYQSVRFHPLNVWGQCIQCNLHLHGNLLPYRENLIRKIGVDEFDKLTQLAYIRHFKHDRFMLIDIIERYKYN